MVVVVGKALMVILVVYGFGVAHCPGSGVNVNVCTPGLFTSGEADGDQVPVMPLISPGSKGPGGSNSPSQKGPSSVKFRVVFACTVMQVSL